MPLLEGGLAPALLFESRGTSGTVGQTGQNWDAKSAVLYFQGFSLKSRIWNTEFFLLGQWDMGQK